jgi:hypothetical protein
MRRAVLAALILGVTVTGCGLDIRSADLFLLTRTGQGHRLTLLVSDGGTLTCDGGKARPLPDPLLLRARDLASALDGDARRHLRLPAPARSVFQYRVRLQNGTIAFPDTAAAHRPLLARVELFAVQAVRNCG